MRHAFHAFVFVLFFAMLGLAASASAQAPTLMPVQGYLSDPETGVPVDGSVDIRFRLYPDPAGEMPHVFEEAVPVTVQDGYFVVYLGETVPLDLAIFRGADALYLGTLIGDDPEGRPLVQLATAPFAAYAQHCGNADTVGGLTSGQLRDYEGLVNVPTEFPPAPHTHPVEDFGLASGTYTPTFANVENVTSFGTVFEHAYMRVGSTVSVWGAVAVTPTAAGRTTFRMSLPMPANIAHLNEARGPVSAAAAQFQGGGTYGDTAYDEVRVRFFVSTADALNVTYSFQYQLD